MTGATSTHLKGRRRDSDGAAPAVPTVFTLGYQQRTQTEFLGFLGRAGIDVLVDVRETAWSHKRGFSKRSLATALHAHGIAYVHAPFAGNPKALRAGAASHAECLGLFTSYLDANGAIVDMLDELIGRLLDARKRVCLACYERHPDDCHRGILAERWQRGMVRHVEHLGADEAYRLIPTT
jgi:uncharacterized protein (DUF488 family)